METEEVKPKQRWPWLVGVGVAVLVVAGVVTAAALGVFEAEPEAAPEAKPIVEVAPEPAPEPEPLLPAVFDIPETQQMPYTDVWNPPDQGEYFWQVVDPAKGYPEDGGTDYVLAHACESQTCAGDELRKLVPGDHITYHGESYLVEEKLNIMKADIGAQDIWTHDPNRLVVITCIIEGSWRDSDKNEIVIATRAG